MSSCSTHMSPHAGIPDHCRAGLMDSDRAPPLASSLTRNTPQRRNICGDDRGSRATCHLLRFLFFSPPQFVEQCPKYNKGNCCLLQGDK